jgi:ABC-type multidrug transport system permease subunit
LKLSHLWVTLRLELKRLYNDKRQVLILILGPIIICLIFGSVYHSSPQGINVTVFVDHPGNSSSSESVETRQLIAEIDASGTFSVTEVNSLSDATHRMTAGVTRAVIVMEEGVTGLREIQVTVDVTDPMVQQTINMQLPLIFEAHSRDLAVKYLSNAGVPSEQAAQILTPLSTDIKTNEWTHLKPFDLGASGVMVLFFLGICLLMSATAITSERSKGTIERIFASPYKGSEIILSKMLAHGLFAVVVSVIIILTVKLIFDVVLANVFLVFIIAVLTGVNAVIFGLLVSAVTYTELESVLLGTLCWFMFILLMGFTWPLETMYPVFQYVGQVTPYFYSLHAMRHVNMVGWGFSLVWPDLVILFAFIVAQAFVAMVVLRREIK